MTDHSTSQIQIERLITTMTDQLTTLTRALSQWMTSEPRSLGDLEQQVMRTIKDVGAALLSGVAHLAVPAYPPASTSCPCGQLATDPRWRTATVKTVLGSITLRRPYYICAACHHGVAPLDQQLGVCAGGISAGLDELLALLGATEDSFAAAAAVLEKLTLVTVCHNTVRQATEQLGQLLQAHEQQVLAVAQVSSTPPLVRKLPAARMYVSMDGVLVHIRGKGWKEMKLGAVYSTCERRSRRHPERSTVQTVAPSFVADLVEAASFGEQLWAEAVARGVLLASEVVVLGDGSHWIWELAALYFPQAVQILDWYHASSYLWAAAHAIYGEGSELAKRWASDQLVLLWDGKVLDVIATLQTQSGAGAAVAEAITYYTYHQGRMHYAEYRARGMQIGSGSIESGCKQVIGARLKQAGMIWAAEGAVAVASVRTWLKSGRWEEAMALRPRRQRSYQRQRERSSSEACPVQEQTGTQQERAAEQAPPRRQKQQPRSPIAQAAEEARAPSEAATRPAATHPWRKPWSSRQQRQVAEARLADAPVASAA
ncbi:MAG: ISKra4 family transposase [Roseiflexaceae bacterium]